MSLKLYQGWQTLRAAANVPDAGLFRLANSFLLTVPRWARLGPTKLFGGNMLRKSQALMAATFFCLNDVLLDGIGPRPGSPQRGGRGQVALPTDR